MTIISPYSEELDRLRQKEYPQLSDTTSYLDHAGTTIPAATLLKLHLEEVQSTLFGNPHTGSPGSIATANRVAQVRETLLSEFFHDISSLYDLVFTSGSTAAVSLVVQLMKDAYGRNWHYQYSIDSHTSLIGQRNCASSWVVLQSSSENSPDLSVPTLTTWPGRSNATGRFTSQYEYPSSLEAHFTLYDASALISTSPLHLTTNSPDFICLSFYKIFGYPSGLGALLVKKTKSIADLVSRYTVFAGGNVEAVSVSTNFYASKPVEREFHSVLEHGTKAFHSILALGTALSVHRRLFGSFERIQEHVRYISYHASRKLRGLRHFNGTPLVQLHDYEDGSPIIAMTLRTSSDGLLGYADVQAAASILGIHIRTGTLCNPGITQQFCGITPAQLKDFHARGHVCSDSKDIVDAKHTGVIRISFGAMSTIADVKKWTEFLRTYFLEEALPSTILRTESAPEDDLQLSQIVVYPIKSCAGYDVPAGTSWSISDCGLQYDRQWAIVCLTNYTILSQKSICTMALIRPLLDLESRKMTITFGSHTISISLDVCPDELSTLENVRVCGDSVRTSIYTSAHIKESLSDFLGQNCTLAVLTLDSITRHVKSSSRSWSGLCTNPTTDMRLNVLFSNESPFLGISESSVNILKAMVPSTRVDARVFRSNFVFSGHLHDDTPFAEDSWTKIKIGDCLFKVLGRCRRCQMICIDQQTGTRVHEPWQVLHQARKSQGKLWFGIHLALIDGSQVSTRARVEVQT